MRDRLIELIKEKIAIQAFDDGEYIDAEVNADEIADHLIENGVVVLPCKVGNAYYVIQRYCNTDPFELTKEPVAPWDCEKYCGRGDCSFSEYRIEEHHFGTIRFILSVEKEIGKTVFLSREEAEAKLKGGAE